MLVHHLTSIRPERPGYSRNKPYGLKVAHINVCSLRNKIDQISHILCDLNLDILGLSETRLNSEITDDELYIDGYIFIRNDRITDSGGGVGIFVKCDVPFSKCDKLCSSELEHIWLEVKQSKQSILICMLYRPPSAKVCCRDILSNNIEKALSINQNVVIMGDFNCDMLNTDDYSNNWVTDMCTLFHLNQLILNPTRITPSSCTLIDLILTSVSEFHQNTKVIPVTLSDHYLIYTTITNFRRKQIINNVIKCRSFSKFDNISFLRSIDKFLSSYNISSYGSVETAWEKWKINFINICDKHAPLRMFRVKQNCKPWVNNEVVTLMKRRDAIHQKAVHLKNATLFSQYKTLRNECTTIIRKNKREYIQHHIQNNKGNPREFWKMVHLLKGSKHSKSTISSDLTCFDLNDHFASVGTSLSEKFDTQLPDWKLPDCIHSLHLEYVTPEHVSKNLALLGNRSNTDILGIDSKLLYISRFIISNSLSSLYNLSLSTCHVPADWKQAKITPIYKGKGSKTDPSNYRPISVISHIAKILERHVNAQCLSYLESHSFISDDQSAFLKYRSTITALHKVNDYWLEAIDNGLVSSVCFFDIKKCFDSLNHSVLLFKLKKYGFTSSALGWFQSYLSNRTHATNCNNNLSNFKCVHIGIPQGSVLGPLLFLIYMNGLPVVVSKSLCSLFADDTMVAPIAETTNKSLSFLASDVKAISKWFFQNKLTINVTKSSTMLIGTSSRITPHHLKNTLGITLDKELSNTDEYCYLGITVDSCLTWEKYIVKLCNKISPIVANLQHLRHFLTNEQINTLYFSYIQPHIDYGLTIWGHCANRLILKVQRFQNRCARIVTQKFDYEIRSNTILRELKWLNVSQRRDYLTCILVFKCLNGLAPSYLSDLLTARSIIHSRSTRQTSANLLHIPFARTNYFQRSFQIYGPKIWNTLPSHVREANTIQEFKYLCRNHILKSD